MQGILQDLRLAFRLLRQSPGFSALAIFTFALGIGVNVAMFSVVDAVALRGLGVPEAGRIVRIFNEEILHPDRGKSSSWIEARRFGAASGVFEGVAASDRRGVIVKQAGDAHMLLANVVSDNYFDVMRVTPFAGRVFTATTAQDNSAPAVVLSYDYWQRRFNGDRQIVGQTLVASDTTCVVIGVLPRAFRGTELVLNPDVYVPISTWLVMNPGERVRVERPQARQLEVFARLRPNITPAAAAATLAGIQQQLAAEYPAQETGRRLDVTLERETRGTQVRLIAALLLGIAGLVLFIAIVNVANLLLVRGEARRIEIATRVALGASRFRTVRQLVTETFVLAVLGGVGALLLAMWVIHLLPALMPPMDFPIGFDFRINASVLVFGAFVTLLSVLVAGVMPALATSHLGLAGPLKTVMVAVGRRGRWRDALVVGQVATTLMLLVASGLLMRTVVAIRGLDAGFDSRAQMLIATLDVRRMTLDREHEYYRQTIERLEATPGLEGAAMASRIPMWGSGGGAATLAWIPGLRDRDREGVRIGFAVVSPDYFSTLGTRIVRGRAIRPQDDEAGAPVTVVNESAAHRLWPDGDPIGQHIRLNGPNGRDVEVVGVAQDGRYLELTETQRSYMFFPLFQEQQIFGSRWGAEVLVIHTAGDAAAQAPTVRRVLKEVNPDVDLLSLRTMEEHIRYAMYGDRLTVQLVGSMGVLGLTLAAIGLFGVISYSVTRRTREIGVRMALGANPRTVAWLVFARAWRLAGLGLAIGIVAALIGGRAIGSFLYGISARDPLTFLVATMAMGAVATAAAFLPARRAARIDPIRAMRVE